MARLLIPMQQPPPQDAIISHKFPKRQDFRFLTTEKPSANDSQETVVFVLKSSSAKPEGNSNDLLRFLPIISGTCPTSCISRSNMLEQEMNILLCIEYPGWMA